MKKIRVALFGAELESINFGCSALAYSQINVLGKIARESGAELECWIFSDDSTVAAKEACRIAGLANVEAKYLVRFRTGLKGLWRLYKDIKACDFVIDLTFGDSFSDIYGIKNFVIYTIPKIVTILMGKQLVLGPQTIGPFYNRFVDKVGKWILKKSSCVVARDEQSYELAAKYVKEKNLLLTSDLAMALPFQSTDKNFDQEKVHVGINVSQLMWVVESRKSNIKLSLSYENYIRSLISALQEKGCTVHFITHVFSHDGDASEYDLAKKLYEEYPGTILAPEFSNPMEAKAYMANLDLFIGARMHATIGAFSAGVPVIPVAYSRKFEGLYKTLGYPYCIDCCKESNKSALKKSLEYLSEIATLEKTREVAFEKAKKLNRTYIDRLLELIEK